MEKRKERYFYLDVLKFISIIMVVFCHYTRLGNTFLDNAFMTLCYIAVPIFFMVNGALLFNKGFDLKKHLLKTLSFYTIATIWRIIYITEAIAGGSVAFAECSKTQLLTYVFLWRNSPEVAGHLWFMQALIMVYLIFPVLYFCFHSGDNGKKALASISAVIFVTTFCATDINTLLIWMKKFFAINDASVSALRYFSPFGYFANMLCFFILGGLLHYKFVINRVSSAPIQKKWRFVALSAFLLSWFLMLFSKFIIDGTWLWNGRAYNDGYNHVPTLLASVAFFLMCLNINISVPPIRKMIIFVASNTLSIYYIHWIVGRVLAEYTPVSSLLANFTRAVLTAVISLLFGFLLSKIPVVKKLVK